MLRAVSTLNAPRTVAASAVAASCPADVTEDTLATIPIPASLMGLGGTLRVFTVWSYTNSANTKTMRVRFGGAAGTVYMQRPETTTVTLSVLTHITNRGVANSQVGGSGNNSSTGLGAVTAAIVTSAVDTGADTSLVITGQKALAGETLTLESYRVELLP